MSIYDMMTRCEEVATEIML